MTDTVLVVGGGIGGLAAALVCARAGHAVHLLERTEAFAPVGVGIQLGPNVTRLLRDWGLAPALAAVSARPEALQVRHAGTGHTLGRLRLGAHCEARYGAPYLTLHRADLHGLLLAAVRSEPGVQLRLGQAVTQCHQTADAVLVRSTDGTDTPGDVLVAADGLWSVVRQDVLCDGLPEATGHLAYRALVPQQALPAALRSQQVTVWLGPGLHVVQYPVQGGASLNLVVIVHQRAVASAPQEWDGPADAARLRDALQGQCQPLQDLLHSVSSWRCWVLHDRPPLAGPRALAQGRVALLGDAAHPMRPYLAQGAGMALEDAATLGVCLADGSQPVAVRLQRYADQRWQRNARVQARARRNGRVFHASGPLRWARDAALRLLGERLLDVPWLYQGGRH